MTQEEFVNKVKEINPDLEVISDFISMNSPIKVKCSICGEETEYKVASNIAYRKIKCPECERLRKLGIFILKLKESKPHIEYISGYINLQTKVTVKCTICGNIYEAYPNNLLKKITGKRIGCTKCLQTQGKTHEEFIQEMSEKNPEILVISQYKGFFEEVLCECRKCKHQWYAKPDHLLRDTHCPKCTSKRSKGEQEVAEILSKIGLEYREQYLYYIEDKKLMIDFYIPKYNCFIEFHGQQHYQPVDFGMKDKNKVLEKFNNQIQRDNMLRDHCKINSINLIEIKYDTLDIESFIINNLEAWKNVNIQN